MNSYPSFREKVEEIVGQIPAGRVMTYGQIAGICGNARAARVVGGIAHYGNQELPWQRVVAQKGGLASGYPGGRLAHKRHLEAEGVEVLGNEEPYCVDVTKLIWHPAQADE